MAGELLEEFKKRARGDISLTLAQHSDVPEEVMSGPEAELHQRVQFVLPLVTQVRILCANYGYDEDMTAALREVALITHEPDNVVDTYFRSSSGQNKIYKRLRSDPQFFEEVIKTYRTQIEPELVPSEDVARVVDMSHLNQSDLYRE